MGKTGIICTIGPASDETDILRKMIKAGMNVARLNFSHGSHTDHRRRIEILRRLRREHNREIKILQDLEGFRIRIGSLKNKSQRAVETTERQILILANRSIAAEAQVIPLDYDGSLEAIKPGSLIYIDDGNIALKAIKVSEESVRCRVITPGIIKEYKGVNIPNAEFPFAGLGEKDRNDIKFGIDNKVDLIAQSFVRRGQDLMDIRNFLAKRNFDCRLIAKIESKDGIKNLDEILEIADGIMVARGDLGVSLPVYKVPILQKMIIKKCREREKVVITATQMLESMTLNPGPTRAEVSDVANAILDGTDYVMLSGETAMGKYPVETVRMMKKIIDFTERSKFNKNMSL